MHTELPARSPYQATAIAGAIEECVFRPQCSVDAPASCKVTTRNLIDAAHAARMFLGALDAELTEGEREELLDGAPHTSLADYAGHFEAAIASGKLVPP